MAAMNEYPIMDEKKGIPLFYPHIPNGVLAEIEDTLKSRWIGQGPKVDAFESQLTELFLGDLSGIAVGSGTDALHLSYLLAGIDEGDHVLVPAFTCTATNIPLKYIGAKPIMVDVDPISLNLDLNDLTHKITTKTKAVVCVDYGGISNDYHSLRAFCDEHNLKLISDAAHSLGSKFDGSYACQYSDFTIFSFQAIKTITTADGGFLVIKDKSLLDKAKRLRWFGIDRNAKQGGVWENDIVEIGYKYQMTDISACFGLCALTEIDDIIKHRKNLFSCYQKNIIQNENVNLIGPTGPEFSDFVPWLLTILTNDRLGLMKELRKENIESAQVHYRNDRYSIFCDKKLELPNMNEIEDQYLVLPLHTKMDTTDVLRICQVVNDFSQR